MPLPCPESSDSDAKIVLRPIVALVEGLPKEVLTPIVIEVVLRYRQLRDVAEAQHADRRATGTSDPGYLAYVRAMIDLHAQQAVLSTLVDVLGDIPAVPAEH